MKKGIWINTIEHTKKRSVNAAAKCAVLTKREKETAKEVVIVALVQVRAWAASVVAWVATAAVMAVVRAAVALEVETEVVMVGVRVAAAA